MLSKLIFALLAMSASLNSFSDTLKPFTTDGCSMFPNGDLKDDSKWIQCCIQHDLSYWMGGTKDQRDVADDELQKCVADVGEKEISTVMHLGVKIGGAPVYPTWYRWGYGWPYSRSYKKLSEKELTQVNQRLLELRSLIDLTIQEMKK